MSQPKADIVCPEYDHLTFGSTYCATEGCRGASVFGPEWDEELKFWEYGIVCACSCANVVYFYDVNSDDWEL